MPLFIVRSEQALDFGINDHSTLILPYLGKVKSLNQLIDICETPGDLRQVIVYSHHPESILNGLKKICKEIPAAGGIVINELNECLFIYRREHWDLPKGKIDPGESSEQAAIREVMEETGINNIQLGKMICHSYHIYRTQRNGNRYLKSTSWYLMQATKQTLQVQTEEDIEQAIWMNSHLFLDTCKPIYNNIREVILTMHLADDKIKKSIIQ